MSTNNSPKSAKSKQLPRQLPTPTGMVSTPMAHLISMKGYRRYNIPSTAKLHMFDGDDKVAINLSDWQILRDRSESTDAKWFSVMLPICLTLLFSLICLVGTADFVEGNTIRWRVLLAALIHVSGLLATGLLSVYFWYRIRRVEQNPSYKQLRIGLDRLLGIQSKERSPLDKTSHAKR
ncbi:MAG: hypothetical protein ISS76_23200 [Phycisphaerae bacterium]|nr:hypothetical protein [Phycisphaerae bacterium]